MTEKDFAAPGTIYQMGLPPRRIDILTEISGLSFDEATADVAYAFSGDGPKANTTVKLRFR